MTDTNVAEVTRLSDGSKHWKEQEECQDCGRDDVPLRAIQMVNLTRQMLCRDCFETALESGQVDSCDPRVKTRGEGGR